MNRETVYRWLLRLYPSAFRREYEEQMLQTFRELSGDRPRGLLFWRIIMPDLLRSAAREHLDVWTCGNRRLALNWVVSCALGTMASGLAIWAFLIVVNALFPPVVDGRVVSVIATNLPTGVYGCLIGLVIGAAQARALRHFIRFPIAWVVVTSLALTAGFPLGFVFAGWFGSIFKVKGYFAGVALLGALVGICQGVLLKDPRQSAGRWVVGTTLAVPLAILAGLATTPLWMVGPRTWLGLAIGYAVIPALIGLVIGVVTVYPLTRTSAPRGLSFPYPNG